MTVNAIGSGSTSVFNTGGTGTPVGTGTNGDGTSTGYVGAAGGTGTTSGTSSTSATPEVDKNLFLKLMVAQLKNQDPMNPTDSSQFLAQTAQFTSLEKLTAVADQTSQALSAQLAFGASGLVGRTVTYADATGASLTGAVKSVKFTSNGPILTIGTTEVALDNVTGVAAPTT